jgi:hypothetical protein
MFQRIASIFTVEEQTKQETSRSKWKVEEVQFPLLQEMAAIRGEPPKESLQFRMEGNHIRFIL